MRTATPAPCVPGTRWKKRSASAARSCSARSTSASAVREGDILAVIDDADYRLALDAAQQQAAAAASQAKQAESDRKRLEALRSDGSVSVSDEERARTAAQTTAAAAEAEARKLELARNRLKYTVLRASRSGVVTAVRFEAGQVVAEGHAGRVDRGRRRARDRGGRARGPSRRVPQGASTRRRWPAPRTRRSTWRCANWRRRPPRRRAPTRRA